MPRLIDADELMWHKSSIVEPRDKTVSTGKPISQDEVYAYRLGWNEAIDAIIENAPTVDAEPVRHGRWEFTDDAMFGNPFGSYKCSECGNTEPHKTKYCSNCGCKMGVDINGTD